MKLEYKKEMTFDSMTALLNKSCNDLKVELRKNPVARFQYIEVRKSSFAGIWIRVFEDKGIVQLINTIPSTIARTPLFGPIITMLLFSLNKEAQTKIREEVGEILKKEYSVKEV